MPLRVFLVALVLSGLAVTTSPPSPAAAASPGCEVLIEQTAGLLAREGTTGVTPGLLDLIRSLGPGLIGCDEGRAEDWGTGMGDDPERWRSLVVFYFSPEDVERVICLMAMESGGNPQARNPSSGAAGLMQVMPFWATRHGYEYDLLFNPAVNLAIASQIQDEQGWGAWTPFQRGECR